MGWTAGYRVGQVLEPVDVVPLDCCWLCRLAGRNLKGRPTLAAPLDWERGSEPVVVRTGCAVLRIVAADGSGGAQELLPPSPKGNETRAVGPGTDDISYGT